MLYLCLDCYELIEELKHNIETHGLDSPPYEETDVCPLCGGACSIAIQCDICNEYIQDDYIKIEDGTIVCSDCYVKHDINDLN